jgi:hypothetical protein
MQSREAFSYSFSLLVCCLCCVSGTEQQLMPACDVLFWNKVIQANQSFFSALWPLIPLLSGGRILFVLRCTHLLPVLRETESLPEHFLANRMRTASRLPLL